MNDLQIIFYTTTEIDYIWRKNKCGVQNITTVTIKVGSDALWGHLDRVVFTPQTRFEKKKIIMKP